MFTVCLFLSYYYLSAPTPQRNIWLFTVWDKLAPIVLPVALPWMVAQYFDCLKGTKAEFQLLPIMFCSCGELIQEKNHKKLHSQNC